MYFDQKLMKICKFPEGTGLEGQSSKEADQARAIQLQKQAFNAQVEKRHDDAIGRLNIK